MENRVRLKLKAQIIASRHFHLCEGHEKVVKENGVIILQVGMPCTW